MWLDAVAVATGAKDRHGLAKFTKWEKACIAALRQDLDLHKLLKVIELEKERLKGQKEFFSPDTCLSKLQLMAKPASVSKWTHEV